LSQLQSDEDVARLISYLSIYGGSFLKAYAKLTGRTPTEAMPATSDT
jgi:hypothetical protein